MPTTNQALKRAEPQAEIGSWDIAEVYQRLGTSPDGLGQSEAQERLQRFGS
ncbi:MAG: hypothetical protein GYA59_05505, partial [Chloroflexi bacterium]|nr:hypothetical protein [Chloroflexota bacterium]